MKVLTLILALISNVLADQNQATATPPPVFITADLRTPIMAPISPNDELFTERMYHIKAIWMRNHPYVLRVLLEEGINTWYDFMDFTVNLDENTINSVKNRKGSNEEEEDDEEYNGTLTSYWRNRFRYALSYINELQIEHGVMNKGHVDIGDSDYFEFCNYCDGVPPFQPYSNELARARDDARKERSRIHGLDLREAEAKAAAAEALRDKMLDEAYHGSDVRSNSRSISDPSQTNSARGRDALDRFRTKWGNTNSQNNSGYGTKTQRGLKDIFGDEDNLSDDESYGRARDNLQRDNLQPNIGDTLPTSGGSVGSRRSNHSGRHSLSSSQRKQEKKKSQKKSKKKYYRSGGGGGGDDSSSSSSNNSKGSKRSVPSFVSASLPDGSGGEKGRYEGAPSPNKPKSKVKLDVSQFPELHDRTPWVEYNIEIVSLLAPHGMTQLLIPTFVPVSKHKAAFDIDDKFLYSALRKTVKCAKGREILMDEVGTLSGQRVWEKLINHYLGAGNIVAEIDKDEAYLRIITPLAQRSGNTRSTRLQLAAAISKWETDFKTYVIRLGKPVSARDKLEYFRRFVSGIKDFQHVSAMNSMVKLVTNKRGGTGNVNDFDPETIIELYKQHAAIVDANNKKEMVGRRGQIVNELKYINLLDSSYSEAGYDIHAVDFGDLVSEDIDDDAWYDVMMARLNKRQGFMPGNAHRNLTAEERVNWDKFTDETKELILSARSSPNPRVRVDRRHNGGNANRTGTSNRVPRTGTSNRVPNTPIAQGATANVTDVTEANVTAAASIDHSTSLGYNDLSSIPEDDPTVRTNVTEMNMHLFGNLYSVNTARFHDIDDLDLDGSHFLQQLDDANREAYQTSEVPPFEMPRFLSQPPKPPHPTETATRATAPPKPTVSFAADSSTTKVETAPKEDSVSQANSVTQLNIEYHDVKSSDGQVVKLLVPYHVAYAQSSVLNDWKKTYPIESCDSVSEISDGEDVYGIHSTEVSGDDNDNSISYRISRNVHHRRKGDLVDRGANGGVKGEGLRTMSVIPNLWVDLSGLDNHTLSKTKIGTCGGVVQTQRGPALLVFHRYALLDRGRTIHSSVQLEAGGNIVDDRSIEFGGQQNVVTHDGYRIPLDIVDGLAYFRTRPYTDDELATLPQVVMTSNTPWRPSRYNSVISDDPTWFERQPDEPLPYGENFNAVGEFLHRGANNISTSSNTRPPFPFFEAPSPSELFSHDEEIVPPRNINEHFGFPAMIPGLLRDVEKYGELLMGSAAVHETREHVQNYDAWRPFFLNAPREVVMHTMKATTHWYNNVSQGHRIYDMRRSHFPACNIFRRHEAVGTDTIFFDIQAWGGYRCCQFYIGRRSYYMSAHGMLTDGDFVGSLEDEIRYRGAMDLLISDMAKAEISARVRAVLRAFQIKDWQSEPHHQNQNIAERYIQEIKKYCNWVLNTSGAPPESIFFIITYAMFIHNRTARKQLGWRTPYEALTGQTPDISVLLIFRFWQVVYIKNYRDLGTGFPSESNEILCHFLGYSETVGHSMTFLVYNPETHAILYRSSLRAENENDIKDSPIPPHDNPNHRDVHQKWHDAFPHIEELPSSPEDVTELVAPLPQATSTENVTQPVSSPPEVTPTPMNRDGTPLRRSPRTRRQARPENGEASRPTTRNDAPRSRNRSRNRSNSATNGEATAETPRRTQPSSSSNLNQLKSDELVGRTVLLKTRDDGQRFRAQIVGIIEDFERERDSNSDLVKFKCLVGDEKYEDIVSYNEMVELIEEQVRNEDGTWRFRQIKGHTKPRRRSDKPKILIEWESGEVTLEPVYNIAIKDRWIVAEYARDNGLIDEWDEIWPTLNLRRHAKNAKKLIRMINQAKQLSYKSTPVYMYGYRVPRNHNEAMELDRLNKNDKWSKSEELEVKQLMEYHTFKDHGHRSKNKAPDGYKRITLHMVYAVKHDGRHKSRIVAGGHLTDAPVESVYSGVVSLRGVRLVIFLAELNGLKVYQTDVGNAYLEAYTKEKVYVIGGPELGKLEGHVLVIVKALYGLKSSGLRWYERFADVLRDMGFTPCPAEPEIWMRAHRADGSIIWPVKNKSQNDTTRVGIGSSTTSKYPVPANDGSYYEYIATYVDDLTIAAKDPVGICDTLKSKYKFKLKGTDPLNFLLGCDYFYEDGVLCQAPKQYIEKMAESYVRFFGEKPSRRVTSPLEKGDHPELDTSEFLGVDETRIYQSMIGSAQWVISIGRFDIAVHIMTLSSFRAQPRRGHLDRIKRVYAYLAKMKHAVIRYRTDMPDVSDFVFPELDWSNTPYSGSVEELPTNLPPARGKPVLMTTFADANLGHDFISGKSVTGLLHFLNKTPFDWFSKKQGTVETATFGSENSAARSAIEQIRANKLTLLFMGVPLSGCPILLGDNKSVVDSGTIPHQQLHKRHLMLSYHFVREAIASGELRFAHINGEFNPSDVLSKHWGYQVVWPLLRPILFWKGDTMDIVKETKRENCRIVGE